jgi:hypothetical protein
MLAYAAFLQQQKGMPRRTALKISIITYDNEKRVWWSQPPRFTWSSLLGRCVTLERLAKRANHPAGQAWVRDTTAAITAAFKITDPAQLDEILVIAKAVSDGGRWPADVIMQLATSTLLSHHTR